MADFTITHRVEAPALVEAINNLAAALNKSPAPVNHVNMAAPAPANVDVQTAAAPVVNPTTPAPVSSVNAPTPAATPTAPAAAAVPSPGAEEKAVTFDDIVAAGSQLLDAGRMGDLLNLLKGFGVQAITQLKPEQFGEVAVALRGLGAKI